MKNPYKDKKVGGGGGGGWFLFAIYFSEAKEHRQLI